MSIAVLFAVLALAAQPDEDRRMAAIEVHEWGVVTFDGGGAVMGAAPDVAPDTLTEPDYPVVERAPVVYFHGPEFSGRFTVAVPDGSILDTWPFPSIRDDNSSTWVITRAGWQELDAVNTPLIERVGGWEAAPWRRQQTMTLAFEGPAYEKFVYYEAGFSDLSAFPVAVRNGRLSVREGCEDMPVALVIPSPEGPLVTVTTASGAVCPLRALRNALLSGPADLYDTLIEWSEGVVDIEEVDALWATWRGWFLDSSQRDGGADCALLIYLLPAEDAEALSVLSLEPDPAFEVRYGRYLLCALEIDLGCFTPGEP